MSTIHFSDILILMKDTCFNNCERIYTIDFSLFLNIKSLNVFVQVYQNCSLVENIPDTFCIANIWYNLLILRRFIVVKCKGHTNFELSTIYERYFQVIFNLIRLS